MLLLLLLLSPVAGLGGKLPGKALQLRVLAIHLQQERGVLSSGGRGGGGEGGGGDPIQAIATSLSYHSLAYQRFLIRQLCYILSSHFNKEHRSSSKNQFTLQAINISPHTIIKINKIARSELFLLVPTIRGVFLLLSFQPS